jgi:hypothetical protein
LGLPRFPYNSMAHRPLPPRVDALKKCMGLFPVDHDAPESAYTPAIYFGGGAAPSEVLPLGSIPSPLNFLAALSGSKALITGGISESGLVAMSALFCILIFFIISHARSPMRKLPPHPQRTPIVGNLPQITDKKWLFSRESKEKYGEYREVVRMNADVGT